MKEGFTSGVQGLFNHNRSFQFSLQFLFQLDSEGSRSGSSLSLRAVAPGGGGGGSVGGGAPSAPSPAHTGTGGGVGGHRGVQRSISATSSNKPRRGSTGENKPFFFFWQMRRLSLPIVAWNKISSQSHPPLKVPMAEVGNSDIAGSQAPAPSGAQCVTQGGTLQHPACVF